jgi:hypothetical protein
VLNRLKEIVLAVVFVLVLENARQVGDTDDDVNGAKG